MFINKVRKEGRRNEIKKKKEKKEKKDKKKKIYFCYE